MQHILPTQIAHNIATTEKSENQLQVLDFIEVGQSKTQFGVELGYPVYSDSVPLKLLSRFRGPLQGFDWKTFVVLGDGEMDEGSNWEALMFAAHHGLSNLVAIIDCNNLQSFTTVTKTLTLEPLAEKLSAFGWDVIDIDGHDHDRLIKALSYRSSNKPRAVIARTIKGKGVSFMENQVDWHYKNPSDEQLATALQDLEEIK